MRKRPLGLFEAAGIEIEYMIVDEATLAVAPVADTLLTAPDGSQDTDFVNGPVTWSNELVLHVIEMKVTEPAPSLAGLGRLFAADVREANRRLSARGARLMPGGMHPFMDPTRETRLWPHRYRSIYRTYDRIFGCASHGWANLQSVHVNLPFDGDDEFGRLHAAVRLVLPVIPALCASSPVVEGRISGLCDTRLEVYRTNQRLVPSVTGRVIPEPCWTRGTYEKKIFGRITRDIAHLDPAGKLKGTWLNSRGAIARFDRGAIEIRLIDTQESPSSDIAVSAAVIALVKALASEGAAPLSLQKKFSVERLHRVLLAGLRDGDRAVIEDEGYLSLFGLRGPLTGGDFWGKIIEGFATGDPDLAEYLPRLGVIVEKGCLARRILSALGPAPSRADMESLYRELCACLEEDRAFMAV